MLDIDVIAADSETEFAALVDSLAIEPHGQDRLIELLREENPVYDQRGTSTINRMRGWVLLTLAKSGLPDEALIFVLEELDTGNDPYLVAAAARALRSYPRPHAALAPFAMRAIANIRYREEPVSFEQYGEYGDSDTDTSPVRELLATLRWLGPHARELLGELESLRKERAGLSAKLLIEVDRTIEAIRIPQAAEAVDGDSCCKVPLNLTNAVSWVLGSRRECVALEQIVFEDQDGASITFREFFRDHPTIVAFFYTRCDNPLKCSLTITKLGRIQSLLKARGLDGQIQTAAITYDPAFDLPERMNRYGQNRGLHIAAGHRMLRATEGLEALRRHFKLGVNFIESLVNRHRLEVYILDSRGRIAASFERIHWDEEEVVARAIEVLSEPPALAGGPYPRDLVAEGGATSHAMTAQPLKRRKAAPPVFGTIASLGVAFFPKCPVCWAGYMSMFGIASLEQIPYSPWLQPLLLVVMLINLASVWIRGRATGRMSAFYLVSAGALAILISKRGVDFEKAAMGGVALTFAGSLLSALSVTKGSRPVAEWLSQRWRDRFSMMRSGR
jgi:protein SCO1/2